MVRFEFDLHPCFLLFKWRLSGLNRGRPGLQPGALPTELSRHIAATALPMSRGGWDRTTYLLFIRQTLYQLSYAPKAGYTGFEPVISGVTGRRPKPS